MTLPVFPTTVSAQAAQGTRSAGALVAAATGAGDRTAAMDSASSGAGAHPMPANKRRTAETLRTLVTDGLVMIGPFPIPRLNRRRKRMNIPDECQYDREPV
jgi:uncharacterized membrane protein